MDILGTLKVLNGKMKDAVCKVVDAGCFGHVESMAKATEELENYQLLMGLKVVECYDQWFMETYVGRVEVACPVIVPSDSNFYTVEVPCPIGGWEGAYKYILDPRNYLTVLGGYDIYSATLDNTNQNFEAILLNDGTIEVTILENKEDNLILEYYIPDSEGIEMVVFTLKISNCPPCDPTIIITEEVCYPDNNPIQIIDTDC